MRTIIVSAGFWITIGTFSALGGSLESAIADVPSRFESTRSHVSKLLVKYRVPEAAIQHSLELELDSQRRSAENTYGEVVSARLVGQIASLQDWLKNRGNIPECDELFPLILRYAKEISDARNGLRVQTAKLIVQLERAGEKTTAQKIREAYEDLGGVLDTDATVSNGAVFVGYRKNVQAADPVTLRVTFQRVAGGQFLGKIEKDWMYRGHPTHQFSGRMDGAVLSAQTGQTLAFGNKTDSMWHYDAFVIGRTIVGEFKGLGKKGQLGGGYFRLDKRG